MKMRNQKNVELVQKIDEMMNVLEQTQVDTQEVVEVFQKILMAQNSRRSRVIETTGNVEMLIRRLIAREPNKNRSKNRMLYTVIQNLNDDDSLSSDCGCENPD
jgi:hypothetical protein